MSSITPRRLALIGLATAGLLVFAGVLASSRFGLIAINTAVVGSAGAVTMGIFAWGCASAAAWAAHGGQRLAWTAMAIGFAGWAVSDAVWMYVATGGGLPVSSASIPELGYVVLPIFAVAAALFIPSNDDSSFRIGLVLDGTLVAASLLVALGSIVVGAADTVTFPRVLMIVITALYLAVVVMGSIVTHKAEPARRLSPLLMTLGFAAIGSAGALRIHFNRPPQTPHTVVILGWVSGMCLLAVSALASRPGPDLDTRDTRRWSRVSMLLPYLPLVFAVFVGGAHFWPKDRGDAFIYSAGMVVIATVLTRHVMTLDRKRSLLEAMTDAALRDTVTGLANRKLLDDRLAHAVQLHLRLAVPISLLRARVDDFTLVNDTLGYAASDALLRGVGDRIQSGVRTGDTVARMGGDEFAIVLEDRPEVAQQVAERLARSFDNPLQIGDHQVYVHLSVGVASTGSEHSPVLTPEDLLNQAEAARTRAEQTSASTVQTFSPDMDTHFSGRQASRDGAARLQLLWDLRRAIDDRMLTLVYQPQFEMRDGSICGAEALLRWHHPTLGTLGPREFLPLVREHGLMDAVTDVVLSQAVADASRWREMGTSIRVAINLWARSLDDDPLPDRIMSVLDAFAMPADLLTVEITEELVVADFAKGRAVLNRLRDAGIRVAIDDFGSGYSTLTYLRELPIDEVKLDRQLVAPILYDQRAATIARSVIELAEEFGIASVAEGVENEGTAQWLKKFGCDVVQGNYFSGPLTAGEIPYVSSNPIGLLQ